ncbi:hypothetical protein [uncultured Nostoc sp.]|uniref:hypothetical protein n=1 Tax=uncultured Nostoc sp. TaxID=340711 RepID=UPI0035C9A1C9
MKSQSKILSLPEDIQLEVDTLLDTGKPMTFISDSLRAKGYPISPRQVERYKRSRISPPVNLVEAADKPNIPSLSEEGISNDDKQQRLSEVILDTLDTLYRSFKNTPDLRTARVMNELASTANNILRARFERETANPGNVNVTFSIGKLEDSYPVKPLENTSKDTV